MPAYWTRFLELARLSGSVGPGSADRSGKLQVRNSKNDDATSNPERRLGQELKLGRRKNGEGMNAIERLPADCCSMRNAIEVANIE